jgi:hypothetical protein
MPASYSLLRQQSHILIRPPRYYPEVRQFRLQHMFIHRTASYHITSFKHQSARNIQTINPTVTRVSQLETRLQHINYSLQKIYRWGKRRRKEVSKYNCGFFQCRFQIRVQPPISSLCAVGSIQDYRCRACNSRHIYARARRCACGVDPLAREQQALRVRRVVRAVHSVKDVTKYGMVVGICVIDDSPQFVLKRGDLYVEVV